MSLIKERFEIPRKYITVFSLHLPGSLVLCLFRTVHLQMLALLSQIFTQGSCVSCTIRSINIYSWVKYKLLPSSGASDNGMIPSQTEWLLSVLCAVCCYSIRHPRFAELQITNTTLYITICLLCGSFQNKWELQSKEPSNWTQIKTQYLDSFSTKWIEK